MPNRVVGNNRTLFKNWSLHGQFRLTDTLAKFHFLTKNQPKLFKLQCLGLVKGMPKLQGPNSQKVAPIATLLGWQLP